MRGTTRTAGPVRVGVTVVDRPGSGFPIVPVIAMIAVAAVAAAWWRRRQ